MSDNKLQKKPVTAIKEKGQYLLAFGVVGSMLVVAGMPIFVIFFFGIFAYFLFRIFASGSRNETRDIFEFYLSANEILRDDGRNWFGFEIRDAIGRGEAIVHRMTGAPPLVYFALGALYNKAGEHQSAINSLTQVVEGDKGNEASFVFPTAELRNYVKVLRKIERDPSEAPLTSAAIRSLERARRIRGKAILEDSRAAFVASTGSNAERSEAVHQIEAGISGSDSPVPEREPGITIIDRLTETPTQAQSPNGAANGSKRSENNGKPDKNDPFGNRKPITEVLHDIYDRNVQ